MAEIVKKHENPEFVQRNYLNLLEANLTKIQFWIFPTVSHVVYTFSLPFSAPYIDTLFTLSPNCIIHLVSTSLEISKFKSCIK